jgi:hypothetical protein
MLIITRVTMTVMTEPQFSPEITEPQLDRWGEPPFGASDLELSELESLGVTPAFARLMREIKHMCYVLTSEWPSNPSPNYCSDVLCRLLGLWSPIEEGALTVSISEAARIATIIACFLPFKNDYPNPALMINVQLHKLKAALEVMFDLTPPGHLLLPWLLGVGGIWSVEPERSWFVGHLIAVADDLNILSYEDYKPHCVKIIWVEVFCDAPFRELWEEVVAKRDKQNLIDLDPW